MFDIETILYPKTLGEALALFGQYPGTRAVAGGQNLLRFSHNYAMKLVSLDRIEGLRGVFRDEHNNLVIGATTTFSDLLQDELILSLIPAVAQTVYSISDVTFRNRATVGGNLCKQNEFCELAAVFHAYDAYVQLQNPERSRLVSISEFFAKKENSFASDELVTAVIIENESLERIFGSTTSYATHNTPFKNMLYCCANVSLTPDRVRIERLRLAFCCENYPSCRLTEAEILAEGSGIFPADITPIIAAILHSIPAGADDNDDHEFLVHLIREQTKLAIAHSIDYAKK